MANLSKNRIDFVPVAARRSAKGRLYEAHVKVLDAGGLRHGKIVHDYRGVRFASSGIGCNLNADQLAQVVEYMRGL